MTFKELATLAQNDSVEEFQKILKENQIRDFNDYLLFDLTNMAKNFQQNLLFLSDDSIWTTDELSDYTLVAQTIDNDYILATQNQVLVIPSSLNRSDSEFFDESIWSFLEKLEEKRLISQIIAVE